MDSREKVSKSTTIDGGKKGKGIAYFALLLSLISLLGVGGVAILGYRYATTGSFTFFPLPKKSVENITLNDKVALGERDKLVDRNSLSLLEQQYFSLEDKIQNNQQGIKQNQAAFNKIVNGRYDWLLNEIEYGLGLVTLQLLNTGNTEAALRSLSHMEDRLENFDSPDLQPLRKSLVEAIASLKQADVSNISDALVNVDLLLHQVEDLPFLADHDFSLEEKTASSVAGTNQPFSFERLWREFLQAIRSGVQVRHLHRVDALLLSPEQIFFIKENIKLRLLTARLSLLQRNEESYLQQLSIVEGTVKEYFELQAPVVQDFLITLKELKRVKLAAVDLSAIRAASAAIKSLQSQQLTEEAGNMEEAKPVLYREGSFVEQKEPKLQSPTDRMLREEELNKNTEKQPPAPTSVHSQRHNQKERVKPENTTHTLSTKEAA